MSESTSGKMMTRPSPLILFASVLLILLSSCSCEPVTRAEKQPLPPKVPLAPVPVPERKSDHVSDVNSEPLKSQASDTGYGAPSNTEYNQQQPQQQDYQPPPPPPPPAQAYGPQVHVTEQDYNRPADQQQAYDQQQQQQSQGYGVKGQSSRPQAAYGNQQQQQAYPAASQPQGYNQPAPAPQSYPAAPQQQSYAPSGYPGPENSYNSQPSSYGSGNSAYQAPGSYNSNPASQSYGTPLESSYESPSDYANDADDEIPYDNADSGYGTSAPDPQQLSPVHNNNYQSSAGQSSGKGQGYQVAAPLAPAAPAYPPPQQPQQQYRPPQQSYPAPQSSQPYPPASASYQQQPPPNQAYENGASQEPSAPSKGGYAAPSGNTYSSPAADSGSSHSGGSDSRGPPPNQQSQSYPETSYSYGQQQQQQQQGSNYNMPLNYGGFRPIQLVAPPASSGSYKSNPSKPLVVAIIQKPASQQQPNSYASPQGDHYNTQLQAYSSHENNQYQSQQIPANSYSGPPLPLNSYASPSANSHSSYQSPSQGSYSPPNSYAPHQTSTQSHGNLPYPSSSGSSGQYPAQPQNYQPEIQQQQHAASGHGRPYDYATEQESSDDEYQFPSGHPAEYSAQNYNPAGPGYPEYPKAPAAQPYPNAGFALDYSEGKPYGGRWLQKPYGKKFVKPKHPYTGNGGALDVTIPLKYGPPPPPEEPKSPAPSYLAPYASVPQVSIFPEEVSAYPFGAPLHAAPLSATLPSKSYRNPSLTQSFGSYGVQNHNLRIPSSYGTLTSDDSDLYASQLAAAASAVLPSKRKKQKSASPVVDASDLAAGLPDDETSYKLIPSASKLIPNIVKSPLKKIMKAFSKNKLLAWKRKSSKEVKSVTSD